MLAHGREVVNNFGFYVQWRLLLIGIFIQMMANCGDAALNRVSLLVEPPAVRKGQHAMLKCIYDLNGAPLYSVKFYRGQLEFYRYSPGEIPSTKVFPFPGIIVDRSFSNASQVLIRNVGFGLSGNFSCEVTADAPYFSTATAVGQMQVVELPEKRPSLWTEYDRYEPGDVLRANCSSPPSRPQAELKLFLNNWMVPISDTQYIRTVDNLIASRISLKLHLQSSHFLGIHSGGHHVNSISPNLNYGIILKCTAQIGNLYQESTELELGVPPRDPIPARVTSNASSKSGISHFLTVLSSVNIILIGPLNQVYLNFR